MNDIIYRGKRLDNGKWIKGRTILRLTTGECYLPNVGFNANIGHDGADDANFGNIYCAETRDPDEPLFLRINPDTLGQYTGMTDKNEKKIFEGDFVRNDFGSDSIGVQNAVVTYSKMNHGFVLRPLDDWMFCTWDTLEVIGNIHDNPELLKNNSTSD